MGPQWKGGAHGLWSSGERSGMDQCTSIDRPTPLFFFKNEEFACMQMKQERGGLLVGQGRGMLVVEVLGGGEALRQSCAPAAEFSTSKKSWPKTPFSSRL